MAKSRSLNPGDFELEQKLWLMYCNHDAWSGHSLFDIWKEKKDIGCNQRERVIEPFCGRKSCPGLACNRRKFSRMDEILIDRVELENNQTLTLVDMSKKISDVAYQVVMEARIRIAVEQSLFSADELGTIPFEDVLEKVGDHVLFCHRTERNFVMADDREAIFKKIVDTFNANIVPYISKPQFPVKLVLKEYRKI